MNLSKSQEILERATLLIPGGVNCPTRSYKQAGGTPPHLLSGRGARARDIDNNEYVDLVMGNGALLTGHANEEVSAVLREAVDRGTTFATPTAGEYELAQAITERMPVVEMLRLVTSGSEAAMSAIRLARAATGRELVLKFEGADHGHADSFLVQAATGNSGAGEAESPGVPKGVADLTLVLPFNNLNKARTLFEEQGQRIACVIVEPIAANMGCILPESGFLEGLRELCDAKGALLIFDEVSTGFRVARGGYMQLTSVRPDLVTLGKVLGGGLPLAAFGGRRDLMKQIAPAGKVYQSGTHAGNPLAVAAGKKTLEILGRSGLYEKLDARGADLARGLETIAREKGVAACVPRQGSLLCFYFREKAPRNWSEANKSDKKRWKSFFQAMLERGVLLPPSPMEAWYLSTAHGERAISQILEAARAALA